MAEPLLESREDSFLTRGQTQELLDVFQRGLSQIRDAIKAGVDVATPNWTTASFVTLAASTTLTNERVLTGTANQIVVTDNGAGSTVVLSTPQDLDTGADWQASTLRLTSFLYGTEVSANPTTSDLTSLAAFAIYMKGDRLIFAYNNAGTITYISIPMDGSTTTWTHNTTAP